jgi:hypothetical protein
VYAVRKDESALDIVQDAMIKLAEKYGDKPAAELPMLFQRILQTTILDYFRSEKVRNTWVSLFSGMGPSGDEHEDFDLLETYAAEQGSAAAESSADQVERDQVLAIIDAEVQNCPRVNAKPSSCVIGRIWTWPKRPRDGLFGRQREDTLLPSNACARRNAESQGDNTMNTEELNFAYKVRHALNETLDDLPPATTDRLAQARQMALARKKADGAARRTALSCAANWPVFRAATGHSRGSTAWASPCPCWCWWLA